MKKKSKKKAKKQPPCTHPAPSVGKGVSTCMICGKRWGTAE